MKRLRAVALVAGLTLALTACSKSADTMNGSSATETENLSSESSDAGADANLSADNSATLDANLGAPLDSNVAGGTLNEGNSAD